MNNKKIFVDTNIFLRYLTNDDPVSADGIEKIFQNAAKGKVRLVTNSMVMAEIIWVLESYYERSKEDIEVMITKILNTEGLEVKELIILIQAINLYVSKNIDFADAYNIIYMKDNKLTHILTLDKKHFSRVDELTIESIF